MSTAAATAQDQPLSPDLIRACLDGITGALSGRPSVPDDQRLAFADAVLRRILSFLPQDMVQLMLAGQAVLFSALTSDAACDILRGMADPMKTRARSQVNAMGRLVSKHLDTLIKLQGRRHSTTAQVEVKEPIPIATAEPPPSPPVPDEEPTSPDEPREISGTETFSDVAPAPALAPQPYPGRETMLAARPSHVSRRKKAQLAHKLMNVLHAARR
jgi:hypothetical protein